MPGIIAPKKRFIRPLLNRTIMQIPFAFVDAFTQRPLAGNQIAIVPHAGKLDEPTMRRIAGELNQTTTFILPPKSDFADWSLKSFTAAGQEVFGAGHNWLGAWCWLGESGDLMLREGRNHFTQEVEVEGDVSRLTGRGITVMEGTLWIE
jgi:trans-2,3-dihydro-3-hydroxyanthranilate isomerase